ncbi:hypothetical protein PR202_ga23918 [Eleusine coracana subsp. coracana]|uniref:Uncharacterized protein n=1 Tax=Eleusine coracana subsp. coracana TaxID=191504 RepID=A0AAV5D702_ELECO|nr:hypothetical protein PR202_ga23918 [Eleusine coracana subsp. coracana]
MDTRSTRNLDPTSRTRPCLENTEYGGRSDRPQTRPKYINEHGRETQPDETSPARRREEGGKVARDGIASPLRRRRPIKPDRRSAPPLPLHHHQDEDELENGGAGGGLESHPPAANWSSLLSRVAEPVVGGGVGVGWVFHSSARERGAEEARANGNSQERTAAPPPAFLRMVRARWSFP